MAPQPTHRPAEADELLDDLDAETVEDLDAETVEDLNADEDAEEVEGGATWPCLQ